MTTKTFKLVDRDGEPIPVQFVANGDGSYSMSVSSGSSAPSGVQRTSTMYSATNAGSTAAGATEISFLNSGAAAAVVAGGSLPAGQALTFDARYPDTLGAIAYDATGTTLLISQVV